MQHEVHRVVRFEKIAPYTLRVEFADCTTQTIDCWPVLKGNMYRPLRDEAVFDQVRIDEEVGTLVWQVGADFDPAILHDWPSRKHDFERLVSQWDEDAA